MVLLGRLLATTALTASLTVACVGETPPITIPDGGGPDGTTSPQPDGAPPQDASGDAPAPTCGAPGQACCGGTCMGGASCVMGTCNCTGGTSACGGTCVALNNDALNCGTCGHDCLGGQCLAGKCQPRTLVSGQTTVSSIAVDATGVYWTRRGSAQVSGAVLRAKLDDGTGLTTLYDVGTTNACDGIALGANDVFFGCSGTTSRTIFRCALMGCNQAPTVLAPNQGLALNVALDAQNARLYYTVGTPYNQSTGGGVWSVPVTGGNPARLVLADQPNPGDIRIVGGTVYWLNMGTYTNNAAQNNGGVRKAPVGVNQTVTVVANETLGQDNDGLDVDAMQQTAYFGNGSGGLLRSAATSGGGAASTFATPATAVRGVVVDATDVYWIETGGSGRVLRCPRTGCPQNNPIVLATNQNNPAALAQDAKSIVWGNFSGGEIRRLAK